ncbi:PRD domain-containing protein [Paenalkalicoccus suaedae]|uniref:PRD domain-containing protein n=1 Tax=Paenalkalicoccus suaedae TaxID=2592382 RepID=A0A859FAT3_9BACI|nr:PRD domain-containing protein [Paenalkalicoccus suaedae]QKS70359.1 PRD domain-containing protein [Paenalkalicoccus suaedae]
MKIEKILNNNVVITENEQGNELVVMGKGLAFQKKVGQQVEDEKIEKTFVLTNNNVSPKLQELLRDVPESFLALSEKILSYAKKVLQAPLDDHIYVSLTDHLSYAVTRHQQGLKLKNPLLWEVRKFYRKEYEVGLHALAIIKEETGHELDQDEAASIALHLLNSQLPNQGMDSMVKVTKLVNGILTVVRYHYGTVPDESSINYERFLTHLRYFAFRLIGNERLEPTDADDTFLFQQVSKKYPSAFECSEKVTHFVNQTFGYHVTTEEQTYLMIHIERVMNRHTT